MPSDNWETVNIYAPLMEDVRKVAAAAKYPNASQYINDAVRKQVEQDKKAMAEASHG